MSNDVAVSVEGIGKRYYAPERRVNKRNAIIQHFKNIGLWGKTRDEDYFWALRDVSFKVPRGQILGILGQNGSGKSTLLKILTGVTLPTTGKVVMHGRVGSLLEVGTGFHPDLSGRNNIYMNGSLLGLSRREIDRAFDAIVDFAGIEEFIDVPVKRYSSGMYVRLAYAVASKLRTDILLLDEVLAVGDTAFQDKARKNMQEVADSGRTILFVSHHVRALASLCHEGLVLDAGNVAYQGRIEDAIREYLKLILGLDAAQGPCVPVADLRQAHRLYQHGPRVFLSVYLCDASSNASTDFATGEDLVVLIEYENATTPHPYFAIAIHNEYGDRVATVSSTHTGSPLEISPSGVCRCRVKDLRLGEGKYFIMLDYGMCTGVRETFTPRECVPAAITFQVHLNGYVEGIGIDAFQGAVHRSEWQAGDDAALRGGQSA